MVAVVGGVREREQGRKERCIIQIVANNQYELMRPAS